jgi:hypothetical protein
MQNRGIDRYRPDPKIHGSSLITKKKRDIPNNYFLSNIMLTIIDFL